MVPDKERDQRKNQQSDLCESALSAVVHALGQPPAVPPEPVDPRVDMLLLELDLDESRFLAQLFENTDTKADAGADAEVGVDGTELDAIQQKRKNPWGGFREAWRTHYNEHKDRARESVNMAETEVQSEVAGTVWKVHVKAGDKVSRDQELMILESMKMEIPVDAPCEGTVAQVLVAPEEGIEEDQVLLIIES